MYSALLFIHSFFRWLVVFSLIGGIYTGYTGWLNNKVFTKTANTLRHVTATIIHIQFIIGYFLYLNSPVAKAFTSNFKSAIHTNSDIRFFGLIHVTLMFSAILLVTLGSAFSKRKETDKEKYKTMAIWFSIALLIIFVAIPWPFSPLANRPYIRGF